jgi:hypothetical protein
MALQTVSSWFLSKNFFVALAFPTQQTGVTGRIGMTWSILEQIQSMSLAWIQTRGPEFGMSVARGEQQQLDQKFRKSARVAMGAFVLAGAAFVGVLGLFPAIAAALSSQIPAVPWEKLQGMINQFLPWPVAATLVAALTGLQLAMIEQFYVRLFKIDPFLVLNVANGPLAAGLFVMFGWQFGVLGAFAAYGAYCWLITLPVSTGILLRERARRRVSSAPPGPPSF